MDDSLPACQRDPSPLRPLLVWLGPLFAVSNISLIPCFATMIGISLSRAFFKGPAPPPEPFWMPALEWFSFILAVQVGVQAFFVTLCITWSPGNYWRRFVAHWLTVFASAALLAIGAVLVAWQSNSLSSLQQDSQGFVAVLTGLPILSLGVQSPFWLARFVFGCRMQHVTTQKSTAVTPVSDSLTLRDMFVATALIAVSLALLQIPAAINAGEGDPQQNYLFFMLIATAICTGLSFVFALPQAILFLTLADVRLAWGMSLAAAGSFAGGYFFLNYSWSSPGNSAAEQLATCFLISYVSSIGSGIGLTLLRRQGWRMVTRWSESVQPND